MSFSSLRTSPLAAVPKQRWTKIVWVPWECVSYVLPVRWLMGRLTPFLGLKGRLNLWVWGMFNFQSACFCLQPFLIFIVMNKGTMLPIWKPSKPQGWKPVVNWVVPMTQRPFKQGEKTKRSCIDSFCVPKVDTLLDLPGLWDYVYWSLFSTLKMLNVDTANDI